MKSRIAIVLVSVLVLLTFSGMAYAAEDDDYVAGYSAGIEFYGRYGGAYSASYAYWLHTSDSKFSYKPVDKEKGWELYEQGFKDGYLDAVEGIEVTVNYAEELGKLLGGVYADRDVNSGVKSDWRRALPSDSSISGTFELSMMGVDYRKAFLEEFKKAFEEGYLEEYEKALLDPKKISISKGFDDGKEVGEAVGRTFGERDYVLGVRVNYKRDLPTTTQISRDFGLSLDSKEYRDAFTQGYLLGYESAYNEAYRDAAQKDAVNHTASDLIPVSGGSVTVEGGITVTIPAGVLYAPAYLAIENETPIYYYTSAYVRASDIYVVSLSNPTYTMDTSKSITIEFPYFGDMVKGGIYRYVNGKWCYLPSKITSGTISAAIEPGTLSGVGNIYGVFVDYGATVLTDARSHWARDEINAMHRRYVVSGYPDGTFKPDNYISRLDFLALLGRAYGWPSASYASTAAVFKDYAQFKDYAGPAGYAYRMGYIKGYPDGYLRPNELMTYSDVETIVSRVIGDPNFKWQNIAEKMLYEKAVRSQSFSSSKNKITRAEVVYMLYVLDKPSY